MTDTNLPKIAAPARRALDAAGIHSLAELARHTEAEIAALHGMGPKALATLRDALVEHGQGFTHESGGDALNAPLV
jgi:hypothetical protein